MAAADILKINAPGLLTTVQDLGRLGLSQFGVAQSGALDAMALRMGNLLVGNPENEAGLEITLMGPRVTALTDITVALTGADLTPSVDGRPFEMWRSQVLKQGRSLSFGGPSTGCRAYLSVGGGIDVAPVLGSKSTNLVSGFGGFKGRPLKAGDILPGHRPSDHLASAGRRIKPEWVPTYGTQWCLRVILGPQDDQFTWEGVETFLSAEYRVSLKSDRTGIRFEGPCVDRLGHLPESIVSEGVMPGAIQIPGDGQPIIILGETASGGYRKIATVISADLHLLGQIQPLDRVWFRAAGLNEAQRALAESDLTTQKLFV